jgi:hypothetical protein
MQFHHRSYHSTRPECVKPFRRRVRASSFSVPRLSPPPTCPGGVPQERSRIGGGFLRIHAVPIPLATPYQARLRENDAALEPECGRAQNCGFRISDRAPHQRGQVAVEAGFRVDGTREEQALLDDFPMSPPTVWNHSCGGSHGPNPKSGIANPQFEGRVSAIDGRRGHSVVYALRSRQAAAFSER